MKMPDNNFWKYKFILKNDKFKYIIKNNEEKKM